ncbi:ribosome biogenesis GTPase Der [Actinacidiphila oryziradicis]|jgi:GTP-binding protein|uniref:GTPase Der n=1 Tax=Actinacidiphila oryziradicis TaxID=2571141 RepID=A0A4U0SHJ8_9ACTN|nr:ribosome biogenesis GTPase Der [Actinacidiphila oryziradicis]MCW2870790.1 engA [Actinacidiphila oryziradicis]TKA09006.1 ribosome biogenesis GTPase Der [Actinacidiphila oryziradicis]
MDIENEYGDAGALGGAEYAEFMELAAEEGFDPEEVAGDLAAAGHGPLPVLAVVGRPNVGKSTLVNRIIGRREAVVEDRPGVTRDRVTYEATWNGRRFKLVDTGGWEQDVLGIDASVAAQAEYAIEAADAVVFVVDSTVGATDTDEAVVRLLRKAGKPVVLAANKVDGPSGEADATALWNLGLGEPYPVSSLHGRGTGDLLDAILEALPEAPAQTFGEAVGGPRRVALIGRPNVGKSSLLNKVAGSERVVVNEIAGTTRDPVDELIELGGITWKFIDTAGIRRRVHLQEGADYYASLRTAAALEKAEVAVILIDGSETISVQDLRIITMAVEAGRAVVIAYNKWDQLDEERRYYLEREIEQDLVQVQWAPRVNVSALTGRHMEKLVPAIEAALAGWETRVPTGRLNAFLGEIVAAHPHPVRGGKQPRILFGTQAGTRPPRFVLFASGFLEAGYRRFIERRLREEFGFAGTPIQVSVRVREKRGRKK